MKYVLRFFAFLSTFIVMLVIFLLGVILILEFGPSETARNLFVNSAMESSAGKFMATLFFSKDKLKEIRKANSVEDVKDITNQELINTEISEEEKNKIEIIDIKGPTYSGYLAVIRDPSRVTIGVSGPYKGEVGKRVSEMAESYGAILATNGGGFEDINGMGNGGTPIGIVISESKLLYGKLSTKYELIGFDKDNKLVVGNMTGKEAIDYGIRDALSFGPILIVNGTPTGINGTGSGLNPRTAIGQKEDGTVLLLVIDGRSATSLGASYSDVQNIFLEYGAINASNLDGGSSTLMYYQGKYINNCSSLYGPRKMPTSIIVK